MKQLRLPNEVILKEISYVQLDFQNLQIVKNTIVTSVIEFYSKAS